MYFYFSTVSFILLSSATYYGHLLYILVLFIFGLKGDFTHQCQFTCHKEYQMLILWRMRKLSKKITPDGNYIFITESATNSGCEV